MNKVNLISEVDVFDDDVMELKVCQRPSTPLTLSIPNDVLEALQMIAIDREMSLARLLKLYIGKGLRQDRSHRKPMTDLVSTIAQNEIEE